MSSFKEPLFISAVRSFISPRIYKFPSVISDSSQNVLKTWSMTTIIEFLSSTTFFLNFSWICMIEISPRLVNFHVIEKPWPHYFWLFKILIFLSQQFILHWYVLFGVWGGTHGREVTYIFLFGGDHTFQAEVSDRVLMIVAYGCSIELWCGLVFFLAWEDVSTGHICLNINCVIGLEHKLIWEIK